MLTADNWSYCYYLLGEWKGMVHLGGEWNEEQQSVQEIYHANLLDSENRCLNQSNFYTLAEALNYLNQHCRFWTMVNQLKIKQQQDQAGSGCSSCQAH